MENDIPRLCRTVTARFDMAMAYPYTRKTTGTEEHFFQSHS
jgi:hypothetical protein